MRKVSLYRFFVIEALFSCFQGLVHPVTPTIFKALCFPDYVFGIVSASTATGMFIFSPLWGKLGDRLGHSRAFSIALPIYAVSQIAFGFSKTPIMAIVTRFFSGMSGGGAMVTALAYIVNATTNENRGRIMSYYAAFNAVSISLGYFIGGVVGNISIPAVFAIQAVALCSASLFTVILIKDNEVKEYSYIETTSLNVFSGIGDKLSKSLIIMLVTTFLTSIAATSFDNSFNYFIKADLNLPSTYNGVIKAITGLVGLTANFTINIYLIRNTNLKKSIIVILMLCGLFSAVTPFLSNISMFFLCSLVYYMFNSIYVPIQQVLVMDNADEKTSGIISGVFNSVKSMGMIFGSLSVGFLYSINSKIPFVITGLSFAAGASVCIIYYLDIVKLSNLESKNRLL